LILEDHASPPYERPYYDPRFFYRRRGEYDPKLEGVWWVEETGMSCNVYYLAEGRT